MIDVRIWIIRVSKNILNTKNSGTTLCLQNFKWTILGKKIIKGYPDYILRCKKPTSAGRTMPLTIFSAVKQNKGSIDCTDVIWWEWMQCCFLNQALICSWNKPVLSNEGQMCRLRIKAIRARHWKASNSCCTGHPLVTSLMHWVTKRSWQMTDNVYCPKTYLCSLTIVIF